MFKNNGKEIEKVQEMSYTELVSQGLSAKLDPVKREAAEIESKISGLIVDLKERGPIPQLIDLINKLREDQISKNKELYKVHCLYAVDTELALIASALDTADRDNRGMDLLYKLAQAAGDMYIMTSEIEKCYGGAFYAPLVYQQMSGQISGLITVISGNLPRVQKVDKEALKQKLYARMEIVKKSKAESQVMKDKYNY